MRLIGQSLAIDETALLLRVNLSCRDQIACARSTQIHDIRVMTPTMLDFLLLLLYVHVREEVVGKPVILALPICVAVCILMLGKMHPHRPKICRVSWQH